MTEDEFLEQVKYNETLRRFRAPDGDKLHTLYVALKYALQKKQDEIDARTARQNMINSAVIGQNALVATEEGDDNRFSEKKEKEYAKLFK